MLWARCKWVSLLSIILSSIALTPPLKGQTMSPCFVHGGMKYLPLRIDLIRTSITGDVDNDGDLDLVLGIDYNSRRLPDHPVIIYLNNGKGCFKEASMTGFPKMDGHLVCLAMGDVDGDGDLDLAIGLRNARNSKLQDKLLFNDGKGNFKDVTASNLPAFKNTTSCITMADVDMDKDLDIILGNYNDVDRLLLNDGKGKFTFAHYTSMPYGSTYTRQIALADLDNDGDLDMFVANAFWESNQVYFNDGKGNFKAKNGYFPMNKESTAAVALVDVDGDGDIDVITANYKKRSRLYLNNGLGRFTDYTNVNMPTSAYGVQTMATGDFDRDGDVDIYLGACGRYFGEAKNHLYLNNGHGVFKEDNGSMVPPYMDCTNTLCAADWDKDGDLDIFAGTINGQGHLLSNDGKGFFKDLTTPLLGSAKTDTNTVCTVDTDGDGDLDIIFGYKKHTHRIFLNYGKGLFKTPSKPLLPIHVDSQSFGAGDMDNDGDMDLLVGTRTSPLLYLNDGKGKFIDCTASNLPKIISSSYSIALGDIDGDKDLDIVTTGINSYSKCRVFSNNGKAKFTDNTIKSFNHSYYQGKPYLLDVDNDGDNDLILIRVTGYPIKLLLNDGKGSFSDFTSTHLPQPPKVAYCLAKGDLDNDGDLDILFGSQKRMLLYINNGKGVFKLLSTTGTPELKGTVSALALFDVDEDGDKDIVAGCTANDRQDTENVLLLNDGKAKFTLAQGSMPGLHEQTRSMAIGDLDGDGDTDIVVANDDQYNHDYDRIYFNLTRHVNIPFLSRIGHDLTVEIHSRPAAKTGNLFVLPMIATAEAQRKIPPFGTLGLDLWTQIILPPIYTDPATATVRLDMAIPKEPLLKGCPIYIQALVEGRSLSRRVFRFTNVGLATIEP